MKLRIATFNLSPVMAWEGEVEGLNAVNIQWNTHNHDLLLTASGPKVEALAQIFVLFSGCVEYHRVAQSLRVYFAQNGEGFRYHLRFILCHLGLPSEVANRLYQSLPLAAEENLWQRLRQGAKRQFYLPTYVLECEEFALGFASGFGDASNELVSHYRLFALATIISSFAQSQVVSYLWTLPDWRENLRLSFKEHLQDMGLMDGPHHNLIAHMFARERELSSALAVETPTPNEPLKTKQKYKII